MKHLMIDIETLDTAPTAAVVQIGAVLFDRTEPKISQICATVDLETALKHGTVSASTLKFWLEQDRETIKSVYLGWKPDTEAILIHLNEFMSQVDKIWSHATFDIPVLKHFYSQMSLRCELDENFRKCMDIRTLEMFAGDQIEWEPREGKHHNALDDAKWQVKHVIKMLNVMEVG